LSSLEESKWLQHVQLTLEAAVMCAEKLHLEGASVVVHCSDGWDRTAQVPMVLLLLLLLLLLPIAAIVPFDCHWLSPLCLLVLQRIYAVVTPCSHSIVL